MLFLCLGEMRSDFLATAKCQLKADSKTAKAKNASILSQLTESLEVAEGERSAREEAENKVFELQQTNDGLTADLEDKVSEIGAAKAKCDELKEDHDGCMCNP
jgi:hypothetical protein